LSGTNYPPNQIAYWPTLNESVAQIHEVEGGRGVKERMNKIYRTMSSLVMGIVVRSGSRFLVQNSEGT
jgi:hypothetical protein